MYAQVQVCVSVCEYVGIGVGVAINYFLARDNDLWGVEVKTLKLNP